MSRSLLSRIEALEAATTARDELIVVIHCFSGGQGDITGYQIGFRCLDSPQRELVERRPGESAEACQDRAAARFRALYPQHPVIPLSEVRGA